MGFLATFTASLESHCEEAHSGGLFLIIPAKRGTPSLPLGGRCPEGAEGALAVGGAPHTPLRSAALHFPSGIGLRPMPSEKPPGGLEMGRFAASQ